MSRMMVGLFLILAPHLLFLTSCGDAGRFTLENQETGENPSTDGEEGEDDEGKSDDASDDDSVHHTGTGAVTVESCEGDPLSCIKNVDRRIYSKGELPRELWCWYGYPGADEYCKVKVNEKAFHKN